MALRFPYRLAAAAALGASIAGGSVGPVRAAVDAVAPNPDQALADAIAKKLAETPGLSGYQVEVTCTAGVVELEGTVKDAKQQGDLAKALRGIKGVRSVDNKTTVRGAIKPVQFDAGSGASGIHHGGGMPAGPSGGMMPPGGMPMGANGPMGGPGMGGGPMGGPMGGGFGGTDPTPIGMPPTGGMHDGGSPRMPPYAWPTYAPHNNYSRVGYPTEYPANAFPFIGPFYPFPKVPLGFRAIKLEWEDGSWYYGRTATKRDWWKVRYW